jgi:hypothetical protein
MNRHSNTTSSFLFKFIFLFLILSFCVPVTATESDSWRWNNIERVVVIPDIHGAYPDFVRLLQTTGLVDSNLNWSGGKSHLVSLGDLLDRGPESRKTMDLLMRLQVQSLPFGGRVHVVAGNHELMNMIGDLRYVAKEEYQAFAVDETLAQRQFAFNDFLSSSGNKFTDQAAARQFFDTTYPPGYFAHRQAFAIDGVYGRWLLTLPAVVVINDKAFVHGGLPEIVAQLGLDGINHNYTETLGQYLRLWQELIEDKILPKYKDEDASILAQEALNATSSLCVNDQKEVCKELQHSGINGKEILSSQQIQKLKKFIMLSESPVLSTAGPLWYRGAMYCRAIEERPILEDSLKKLGVNQVVVGHTTSPDATVHSLHDNKLVMLDTGMLVKYYSGRPAALVIENNKSYVQYLNPTETGYAVPGLPGANGISDEQIASILKNGEIITAEGKAGTSTPWEVKVSHNGKVLNALFYPGNHKRQDKQEIAAYKLDQLLGFDLVPITVARSVMNTTGALQLSYQDRISEAQRLEKSISVSGLCSMNRQIQLVYTWDLLTANTGRNADNLYYRQSLGLVYLTEHTEAFSNGNRLPKSIRSDSVTLSAGARNALENLNEDNLNTIFSGLLNKKSIQAILSRRDAMLNLFK